METVTNAASNAASTASKMIWGEGKTESGQEPVSGQQGSGTKTEPFDQGNKEVDAPASTEGQTTSSTTVTGETGGSNPSTSVTEEGLNTTSSSVLGDSGRSNPSTSATEEGLNTTSSSVLGGSGASAPSASTTGGQTAGSTAPGDDLGASDPSTTATGGQTAGSSAAVGDAGASDPSTGSSVIESQKPIQEHQGADKPIDEPIGGQKDAVKESKDAGEKAMAKRDPNDHSGEPMHVHDDSEKKEEKTTGDDSGKSMEDKAKEQGTGEHWVKTSGMAAEGGDFDATKPGAGREAERLMEEKGIKSSGGDNHGPPAAASASSGGVDDSKAKPKMMDKVKEKLHIHKH